MSGSGHIQDPLTALYCLSHFHYITGKGLLSMTNEDLAALIAEGGNDELTPLLWERMRRFYRMSSEKYAAIHAEQCARYGVTAADIFQESYFAFLDSVKYFGSRKPEQAAFRFISFCGLPFKNHAGGLIGLRSKSLDALDCCTTLSLDEQVQGTDGEPDTPRGELVPDPESTKPFEEIDRAAYNAAIREAVEAQPLTESESAAIHYFYFEGKTLQETGAAMGISCEMARIYRNRAKRKLWKSRELRLLYEESPYKHISLEEFRRRGSIVEQITEERERKSKMNV